MACRFQTRSQLNSGVATGAWLYYLSNIFAFIKFTSSIRIDSVKKKKKRKTGRYIFEFV